MTPWLTFNKCATTRFTEVFCTYSAEVEIRKQTHVIFASFGSNWEITSIAQDMDSSNAHHESCHVDNKKARTLRENHMSTGVTTLVIEIVTDPKRNKMRHTLQRRATK